MIRVLNRNCMIIVGVEVVVSLRIEFGVVMLVVVGWWIGVDVIWCSVLFIYFLRFEYRLSSGVRLFWM